MPRNQNGQYFLPDGNPVVSGELITAEWANSTLDDIAEALTESLDRSGAGGMTAPLRIVDGAVNAPAVAFSTEPGTGVYKPSNGVLGVAVGGKSVAEFNGNGVNVPGVVNAGSLGGAAAGGAGANGKWNIAISGKADTAGRADSAAYADESENSHKANGLNAYLSNWANWDSSNNVVGMLGWRKYGNSHVVFDASGQTSPSDTGIDNVNSKYVWAAGSPTLMGWNGSETFGVRVDTARYAESAGGGIVGEIRMFAQGVSLPAGWHICDGNNGTPNLIDRFIVAGGGKYPTMSSGGSTNVPLPYHQHAFSGRTLLESADHCHGGTTANQDRDHSHYFYTNSYGAGYHEHGLGYGAALYNQHSSGSWFTGQGSGNGYGEFPGTAGSGEHSHPVEGNTGGVSIGHYHDFTTGGVTANHFHDFGGATDNAGTSSEYMPPYYALIFAMYTGS